MTARQIMRVHAGMFEDSLPLVVLQRHDRDFSFLVVPVRTARVEQRGLASRQDLRPAMGVLSSIRFQRRERDRLSSLRWNLR
jgi:hypothetical protein